MSGWIYGAVALLAFVAFIAIWWFDAHQGRRKHQSQHDQHHDLSHHDPSHHDRSQDQHETDR